MQLSSDDFLETVESARDCLRNDRSYAASSCDFARALVQAAETCLIGIACEKHGGAVHGQEAEELRAGVEQILTTISDVHDEADALLVLRATRKALILLLDRVDARDSLAFREVTNIDGTNDVQVASKGG